VLQIRPIEEADFDAAAQMYRTGGWSERRAFLEWTSSVPACRTLVGLENGRVVATGMATINGPVGWVGSIFVDRERRGRGYGRRMTEAACELIRAAGCGTEALIASPMGEPLYVSMGFRHDGYYEVFEAATRPQPPRVPDGLALRSIETSDLGDIWRLDRRATGEDRAGLLSSLAGGGSVLLQAGRLRGYLLSVLPDSGALSALDARAGLCLLDQLRYQGHGKVEDVHAAVPTGHEGGPAALGAAGWRSLFRTPRMLRGESIAWEPGLIWSILGFAFG
jgi:GNAT superfamily N-acetyltransferase